MSKYTPSTLSPYKILPHKSNIHIQKKKEKRIWGGKIKADFCCHRGTLDSAKVINLTMHRTNRGAEFLLKNVPYLIRGVGSR